MGLVEKASRLVAAARGDDVSRYVLAERLARALHPDAVLSEKDRVWMQDEAFQLAYRRMDPLNLRRLDRAWNLRTLAEFAKTVPGDTAECGVYRGLTSYFICEATRGSGKVHHAFDSFQGLSTPIAADGQYWARGDLSAPEAAARAALAEFDMVRFYVGWIPERFVDVDAAEFSLVHVDVDLYEPTRDSLSFFLPRMAPGGAIVLDDYGFTTCPGARRAADELCAASGRVVIELSSGQGLILS